MSSYKLNLCAAIASIFISPVSQACEIYQAERVAKDALMKKNLSCLPVYGAKKCFIQMGPAEKYKSGNGLIAVPYFSITDNGYLANFGSVLVKTSCEVQYIQEWSTYQESIRVIDAE